MSPIEIFSDQIKALGLCQEWYMGRALISECTDPSVEGENLINTII
jgi:hypothetical protein